MVNAGECWGIMVRGVFELFDGAGDEVLCGHRFTCLTVCELVRTSLQIQLRTAINATRLELDMDTVETLPGAICYR